MDGELWNVGRCATLAGVHPMTIRAWIRAGRLEATQTPLGFLVKRESIEKLIAQRAARPTPLPAAA